jgi:hypothetical protein
MNNSSELLKEFIRMAIPLLPDPRTGSGYSHIGATVLRSLPVRQG